MQVNRKNPRNEEVINQMQEETTEKSISLCIKGAKVTEGVLKAVLKKLVSEMNQ